MSYKKDFEEHMEKSKKLADDFEKHRIHVDFDKKTGEISFPASEITEDKLKNWGKEKNDNK